MVFYESGVSEYKPWPSNMPSGWAHTPSGSDSNGYYSQGVAAWAQITPYFQNLLLKRMAFGAGYTGTATFYSGVNTSVNARLGKTFGAGGGYTNMDSFGLEVAVMGDGNFYADATGGYNIARTVRHELAHAIDFMCWGYGNGGATVTSDTSLATKYTNDNKPSLMNGSLAVGAYSRNNIYEWFAEFFSEMMAERVLGYSGVCDGNRTTPGTNCVWAINWFNAKFPGWTGKVAPAITSATPASGTSGTSYSHAFVASGSPAVWSIITGALPTGLSLNSATGAVTGTPSAAGTSAYTVAATNVAGSVTRAYSTTVASGGDPVDSAAGSTALRNPAYANWGAMAPITQASVPAGFSTYLYTASAIAAPYYGAITIFFDDGDTTGDMAVNRMATASGISGRFSMPYGDLYTATIASAGYTVGAKFVVGMVINKAATSTGTVRVPGAQASVSMPQFNGIPYDIPSFVGSNGAWTKLWVYNGVHSQSTSEDVMAAIIANN